ncbi:MAG: AAA family ATPase [Nitrospiraceae bacterium]|nr:AAA family ATPase [Nitrospiraceae bacterium]
MYLDFYNLEKKPFQTTPDPEFLFLSPSHNEALASIIYGVEQRKGFIAITGEVGVGKTTIIRSYLEKIDKERLKTIYIFNPDLSFAGLLKTIFSELAIDAGTEDPLEMLNRLYAILIDEYKNGRNVALVIDEAQNMPVKTLENLRILSNLETSRDKLIQIVLVGQPELAEMLGKKELRQLRQRIVIRAVISPLSKDECAAYIQHRLAKASPHGATVFTRGAMKKIIASSRGIPRTINILCDNALVTGFGYQKKRVNARIVKEVAADLKSGEKSTFLKLVSPAMASILLAAAVLLFTYRNGALPRLTAPPGAGQSAWKAGAAGDGRKSSAALKDPADRKRVTGAVIRSVRRGDTLLGLLKHIYGHGDPELVKFVMQNNKGITNSNVIREGDEIVALRESVWVN